jgi:hypothetical protein
MFIINSIKIDGYEKDGAIVSFERGFNYITGSSDKGKTFIFQCIKYMLGGSTTPKEIKEAKGYSSIYMQIIQPDGTFTLHRDLSGGALSVFSGDIDSLDVTTKAQYTSAGSKNSSTISEFYLRLIGITDVFYLRTNQYNEKQKLSFTNLRELFVVSETDIISDKSHFQPPEITTDQTLFKSLFKFILSREDDSNLSTYDKKDVFNARKGGKIELLRMLIENNGRVIESIRSEISKIFSVDEIEASISFLKNELSGFNNHISSLRDEMRIISNRIDELRSEITSNLIILKKLDRLKDVYGSDVRRLDFISESSYYLNELSIEFCEKCGNPLSDPLASDGSLNMHALAAEAEKIKTKKLIHELSQTIEHTKLSNSKLFLQLRDSESSRSTIDDRISNQKRAAKTSESNLENIVAYRSKLNKIQDLTDQNRRFNLDIINLDSQENNIPKMEFIYNKNLLKQINKRMERILTVWFAEQKTVEFNESKLEFEINGELRSSYGKGFRSIYRLAAMLALTRVLKNNNIPISDFIVCDTPFTPFREKDSGVASDNGPIQKRIFSHIANSYNDMQVILFENKDLTLEDEDKAGVNMILFEGDSGFFPST